MLGISGHAPLRLIVCYNPISTCAHACVPHYEVRMRSIINALMLCVDCL